MVPNKRTSTNEPYHKQMRPYSNNHRFNQDPGRRNNFKRLDMDIQKSRPNNILRIKIINAIYEVTTDTLYFIFSKYGSVQRIVMFMSAGILSAMIEFDSVNGATIAREYLDGFNIYLSCNTLQVEFAWTTQLIVSVNDIYKSWDYTMDFAVNGCNQQQEYPQYFRSENSSDTSNKYQPTINFATTLQCEPNVMIVTGIEFEQSNVFKLFNLFSLYGNVARIQFMPNQPGAAIIQMFDQMSVECCIRNLNYAPIGTNGHLMINWTNQAFQPNGEKVFQMPDASYNFHDFSCSKNQRFLVGRPNYWIQAPSKVLRFYNTPIHATVEMMMRIFSSEKFTVKNCIFLPVDGGSLSRGLLEFNSIPQAMQAVMECNNKEITIGSNVKYLKLAFSSNNISDSRHHFY